MAQHVWGILLGIPSQLFLKSFWDFYCIFFYLKKAKNPRWTWKPGFNTPLHSLSERHPPLPFCTVTHPRPPTIARPPRPPHIFVLVRLKLFRVFVCVFILNVKWQKRQQILTVFVFFSFVFFFVFCFFLCQKNSLSAFDRHLGAIGCVLWYKIAFAHRIVKSREKQRVTLFFSLNIKK